MYSDLDTSAVDQAVRRSLPPIQEIGAGRIVVTQGDPDKPDAIAALRVVGDLIAAEKVRLLGYRADRKRYQLEAADWAKAHPSVPHDETIVLRPHRGSRYLANPRPAEGAR